MEETLESASFPEDDEKKIEETFRTSNIGRHAIVDAISPTIKRIIMSMEEDAILSAFLTEDSADPFLVSLAILSTLASIRNLQSRRAENVLETLKDS